MLSMIYRGIVICCIKKMLKRGGRYFLAVWCLELHASTAGGLGSIPGWGTKIPQALWCGGKNKTKNGFQRVENRCVKFSCAVLSCSVMSLCSGHTPLSAGILLAATLEPVVPTQGWTQISCILGGFFTVWATREALRAHACLSSEHQTHVSLCSTEHFALRHCVAF